MLRRAPSSSKQDAALEPSFVGRPRGRARSFVLDEVYSSVSAAADDDDEAVAP